ncbi:MAG: hypothetical protein KGI50_06010 [Patescibacteria group bacterium]|nr:hypothetical protein [Patescibacteria group bacterium]
MGKLDQAASHIIDDRIIFIAGYHWIMPGVIEVWMHPSVYLPRYKFSVVKHLRWWFCFIKEATDARRIQTWGAHNEASDRWLISLGFEREGVLESYLPDGSSVSMWRLGARCKPSQQL